MCDEVARFLADDVMKQLGVVLDVILRLLSNRRYCDESKLDQKY